MNLHIEEKFNVVSGNVNTLFIIRMSEKPRGTFYK